MIRYADFESFDAFAAAAAEQGLSIMKYADPTDDARAVTPDEARAIAAEDHSLIFASRAATVREGSQYIGRFSIETAPNDFIRRLVAEALEYGESTETDEDGCEVTAVAQAA